MTINKTQLNIYFYKWLSRKSKEYKINRMQLTKKWIKQHSKELNLKAKIKYFKEKIECYEAYGNKCSCCGEKEFEFLTIDHIGGRGICKKNMRNKRKHLCGYYEYRRLKKLNYPKDKYRLLCMNCNFATRGGRICPHKK